MFRTCIYCHHDLGDNEALERFPVGRRLAFDAHRGRLWVICRWCRCWNLSPLEERWEAIDECEARFDSQRTRFSTAEVGLARLPSGLELVRIGRPRRDEFAAWRYARRFAGRRIGGALRHLAAEGLEGLAALSDAIPVLRPFLGPAAGLSRRPVARIPLGDGGVARIERDDLTRMRLEPSSHPDGFALNLIYWDSRAPWWRLARAPGASRAVRLHGGEAVRTAGLLLPRINAFGGTRRQVGDAVSYVDAVRGEAERLYATVPSIVPGVFRLAALPVRIRLALEMAAHEETERRALAGELALLEQQWHEAEEIAAIADRLLVPAAIEEWIRAHRDG